MNIDIYGGGMFDDGVESRVVGVALGYDVGACVDAMDVIVDG